ncbi:MAG: hypothetical protein K6A69_08385 [Lachnospiraceae bacterium]|nr:hypothetical protein [Lachnospiraceae bacterium]
MFIDEIHVTFYADIAAAILSLGVYVLCSRGIIKDAFLGGVFRLLLIMDCFLAVVDAATYARKYHEFPGAYPIALGLQTLLELVLNFIIFLWLVYVNYKVYHSRDSIKRKLIKNMIPLFILMAIDIINVFTGILFYYDEHVMYHTTWFTIPYYLIRYFYFFSCVIQISVHKRKGRDLKFFEIWAFIIPVLAGGLITNLTAYSTTALGFAVALFNVYAGIINEQSFMDSRTGFFNRYYLRYLRNDVDDEGFAPKSGMICRLEDPEDMTAFSELLSPLLPKKCEVVRFDEETVIMLAEISKKAAMQMMSEDVEAAVEKYNSENSGRPLSVTIDTVFKKKKETCKGFYDMFIRRIG